MTTTTRPSIELFTADGWWWADLSKATGAEEFTHLGVAHLIERAPMPFGSRVPAGRVIALAQQLNPHHVITVRPEPTVPQVPRYRCTVCGCTSGIARCLRSTWHHVEPVH